MTLPPRDAYRKATERARAHEHELRLESLKRLDASLLKYANDLTRMINALEPGAGSASRRLAAAKSLEIALRMREQLNRGMEFAVASGRNMAFADILKIQNEATLSIASAEGISHKLLGAVTAPSLTMAGVWESLGTGAATWRTLLRGYGNEAVADAQRIVTTALIEGMAPGELAKRLRPYVLGAESFRDAFKGANKEITNKMLNDPSFSGAARRLRFNADRIAFSEIHNARAEAEIQAFAADPFVKAVRWQLSPNRGTQRKRDACDGLSKTDFFGLGAGVYPVSKVPISPHPFCRCERVPVPRGIEEMHLPKPNPPRKKVKTVIGTGCSH